MKNIISFLIGLIIVNALSAQTAEVPAIGDGTSGNPYQIANLNNLYWLSQNSGEWNKYYIQTTSIDASDTENWNGGEGFDPIGNSTIHFTGEYNGNFNTIEGFYINRPDAEKQAMFGMINGAVIQNLQLENVSITARRHLGALVGFGGWSALVQNCSSSGSVNTTYDWAGGLIGYASNGFVVSRCSSSCNVSGAAIGGLIGGTNYYCEIYDCYATGAVNGGILKGGLIGSDSDLYSSSVNRSYSTGYVSPGNWSGGFIGDDGAAYDCFWDIETSGQSTSAGGTGKSTEDMQSTATFTDLTTPGLDNAWDFLNNPNDDVGNDDIWNIDPALNNGYPILSWQVFNADFGASSTEILLGDSINFLDYSMGFPTTWAWDFDDDDIIDSTEENPMWEYTSAGIFTVKLTITDGRTEDSETKIDYITVTEPSITEGLVAHYPFTGNANDESGNANHGTTNGVVLDNDRFGEPNSAYYFDGSNDYIEVADSPSLRPTDLTLSGWFKFDVVSPAVRSLIGKTVGTAWRDSYTIWRHDSMKGATGSDGQFDELAYSHATIIDEWYHIAYTYDDETDTHSMFINGVLVKTEDNFVSIGYDSHPLIIGADIEHQVLSYFFHGTIDDIRIYNRALADVEIEMLYAEANPALAVPQNLTISIVGENVELDWDAVTGASSYKVYSDAEPYGGFGTTEWTGAVSEWSEAIPGDMKFYRVTASND